MQLTIRMLEVKDAFDGSQGFAVRSDEGATKCWKYMPT